MARDKKESFDVFLAHNSRDKPEVIRIKGLLEERGIRAWLDKHEIPPGRWFQDVIQAAIPDVKSAAIFLGRHGLGRWQLLELRTFISQCVEHGKPVIPVLLPGAEHMPAELAFLKELNWVQFGDSLEDQDAIDSLVWGITGEKPGATRTPTSSPSVKLKKASRRVPPTASKRAVSPVTKATSSDDCIMLGDRFFMAPSCARGTDGRLTLHVRSRAAEDDAFFRSIDPGPFSRGKRLAFALQNDGGEAVVAGLRSESKGAALTWILELLPEETGRAPGLAEFQIQGPDGRVLSADRMAELRARRILLDEPIPQPGSGYGGGFLLNSALEVPEGRNARELFAMHRKNPKQFLKFLRLAMIQRLLKAGIVEHVLELALTLRSRTLLQVKFRGQRKQTYSNVAATIVEVNDSLDLAT